jgi:hypothetical protein
MPDRSKGRGQTECSPWPSKLGVGHGASNPNKKKKKLRGLSPQTNYTDRATAAVDEVVPTFAGRGYYVVSATDSHDR